jgi:hypothetical protein
MCRNTRPDPLRDSARGRAFTLIGAALLAGCAAQQGPQEALTAPVPSAAPAEPVPAAFAPASPSSSQEAGLDGLYRGTSTRYLARRRDCPHPGLVELYVQGGQFTYRWDRDTQVLASIAPDGTVTGQEGSVQLTGRVDGPQMTGDLTNGSCALHFTVERRFRGV